MASVTNLTLNLQTGSDSTYYASWTFDENTKVSSTTTSGVSVGSLVSIKSGATYYNGVAIPSWVKSDQWYISSLKGDRAVLGKNKSGSHNITSPINTKYLTVVSGGSSSTTTTTTKTLDYYTVEWFYDTGDGVWFSGGSSNVTVKNATYSGPSNAIRIKVTVKPVAKTHKVNNKDTAYWSGTSVSKTYEVAQDPPDVPSVPTVTIDKYQLTATIENISDAKCDQIYFEVYNGTKLATTGTATVLTCRASFTCTVSAGGKYRVRCRAINIYSSSKIYSGWSDFSSEQTTIPTAVTNVSCAADSETSVKVTWTAASTATSYTIEYTDNKLYFDSSSEVSSVSVTNTTGYVTGLDSGKEWFFRVKAVNDSGDSSWSNIVSSVIGSKPSAPTTWSSTTTAVTGEELNLYWVHNSEDGSSQTYAELEIYIDGVKSTYTIQNSTNEDEKDKTSVYSVNTASYVEGTSIQWRVRTAGITKVYGDWSIQRTVDIYAPPTLTLAMTDIDGIAINTLTSFPFYISGLAGPKTQAPISYNLSVISNESYQTVDQIGNTKIVNYGEQVYSKHFDTSEQLLVELSANNIDLENGITYTVTCTVSMDSGLTAETSLEFIVSWTDVQYEPDAEINIDDVSYSAYIRPYCIDETGEPITDVMLSIYRRDFDGSFTELISGVDNDKNIFITDPHPALDYARYRIVAISKTTGAVSYYDPPGYPVGGTSVIIQWDEEWRNLDTVAEDALEQQPWSGSLLKLPYNIDVTDKNDADVSLVEYIGRKHPVSYYGTQIGSSSSWNMEIPKSDKETLYALRRLSVWMGDVYVREPSGSGYWASISVSFSQKHCEVTIPVTLDIVRVEGGI